ncbi:hypothetical protein U0070_001410 [Myodes glareolus]|uniref:Uncharacterized protein n=1 Tax=Myodes glareolus TaxID=447135 RepID=A0AAW0IHF3_MYOGA
MWNYEMTAFAQTDVAFFRQTYNCLEDSVYGYALLFLRWSAISENLFATTGYPGKMTSQFQIHHLGHSQPILTGSVAIGSGLSWHRTLPLCAVGGDHKLLFWVTEI